MIVPSLLTTLVFVCLLMALAWWVSNTTGKSGFTDVFWTYGTGVAGVVLVLVPLEPGQTPSARQVLVAVLLGLWALRLGSHILARTQKGGDDPRYAKLKRDWGSDAPRRMFWFLQVQAVTMALLALAVFAAAHDPRPGLDWRDWIAVAVVGVGILGETLSDEQLKAFARNKANKGKVCDTGLWAWSRHPNYFFEFLGWWAYPILGIELSTVYPWGWLALIGPAMLYWLLVHASGIPPLEAYMLSSRGEAFRDYQARTSAFLPMPPRPTARDRL